MPCNAWNHSADCECGWGGATGSFADVFVAPAPPPRPASAARACSRTATLETFTTPNARCPVCRAEVFFYQSPHGGRVFFDEIGPPWPKHPCTDRSHGNSRAPTRPASVYALRPIAPEWLRNDWLPLTSAAARVFRDGDLSDGEDKTVILGLILAHPAGKPLGCVLAVPGQVHVELNRV